MEKKEIQITKDLRPTYYDDFHCIMSACQLNCCKYHWLIAFQRNDYLKLKKQRCSAELSARMKQSLHRCHGQEAVHGYYGMFVLQDGVCPMLTDGLCSLQKEKGEKILPMVCRVFPRHNNYSISGYLERALSPGCEGVLELLWNLKEGVIFSSDPLPQNECIAFPIQEDASKFSLHFQELRSICIDFLQARQFSLPERILLMGSFLKKVLAHPKDVGHWKKTMANVLLDTGVLSVLKKASERGLELFLGENIYTLLRFSSKEKEILYLRNQVMEFFGSTMKEMKMKVNPSAYFPCRERLEKLLLGHEIFFENLMVSVFFQLMLPSVRSDENLWESYVSFCNLYSFYRFIAVISCYDETKDATTLKAELFHNITLASRELLHDPSRMVAIQNDLFQNKSDSLAHMAILLSN